MQSEARPTGMSLIEILSTIALVAMLSTVAVPNYLSSKADANEATVVRTLRAVAAAQDAFRRAAIVDRDGDGIGEFGTLRELAAGAAPRGRAKSVQVDIGPVDARGLAHHAGHLFALFLPDATGRGIADDRARRNHVDPELAERHFTCIAWPVEQGRTGTHTWLVDASGLVRRGRSTSWSGEGSPPPAGAAVIGAPSPNHMIGTRLATDERGVSGAFWTVVR